MTSRSTGFRRLGTFMLALLGVSTAAGAQDTAAGAQYTGDWTPIENLDLRPPLEIAQVYQAPPYPPLNEVYLPVLFDEATNALDMVRIDLSQNPATASPIQIANGAIFALGPAVRVGDRVGTSFIDDFFDVRFGGCDAPCTTTFNFPVNAGTWIDSSSAASADDFFVAGLDNNATHGITIFNSTDAGETWETLNTLLPPDPGGVYDNFHGGKRIHLVTDPLATDPATTRNCLFYETRPSPGTTTAIHLNCRNGASNLFDVIVDTDIPNPNNQFDPLIETECTRIRAEGGGLWSTNCRYSQRQTGQVRLVQVNQAGQVLGPIHLTGVPTGNNFYSCAPFTLPNSEAVRVVCPSAGGAPANDIEWSPDAGSFAAPGPEMEVGPVRGGYWQDSPLGYYLVAFYAEPGMRTESPLGGGGLGMSRFVLPIFADSFETQNVLRWSSHTP